MLPWSDECSRVLMSADDCLLCHHNKLMSAYDCSRLSMSTQECSWPPISAFECSWIFISSHEISSAWRHQHSSALMSGHDHSWAHIGDHEQSYTLLCMVPWILMSTQEHSGHHGKLLLTAPECRQMVMSAHESSRPLFISAHNCLKTHTKF